MKYLLFFKQKTAYEVRSSDWSSDVCSSDLSQSARYLCGQDAHSRTLFDRGDDSQSLASISGEQAAQKARCGRLLVAASTGAGSQGPRACGSTSDRKSVV